MDVILVAALERERNVSASFLGKKIPSCFVRPATLKVLRLLGAKIRFMGLDADLRERLDRVSEMYASIRSCSSLHDHHPSHAAGFFEPIGIYCLILGETNRSDPMVDLMVDYLRHALVPQEVVHAVKSSRRAARKLRRIADIVRKTPPSGERIIKFIIFGTGSATNRIERELRRMIPGSMGGISGFLNGSVVFFSAVRDTPFRKLSLFEWRLIRFALSLTLSLFPRARARMLRKILPRFPVSGKFDDDAVSRAGFFSRMGSIRSRLLSWVRSWSVSKGSG